MSEKYKAVSYGLQKLEYIGYIAGRTTAIVADSFTRGVAAGHAAIAEQGAEVPKKEPVQSHDSEKESICRKCWCNTCAKLMDGCDAFPPSPDGSYPLPCAECQAKDCAPLMPKVRSAECGTYI